MAQLYFIFSTMNSGKSLDLLRSAHGYEEKGRSVLLFTSEKDTRGGALSPQAKQGLIITRLGEQRKAWLMERVRPYALALKHKPAAVLVDEIQFAQPENVEELARIVDELDIPVICYGLKNDFRNHLFPATQTLLALADKIQEIKTICQYCDRKATMNMRLANGKAVFAGDQVQVGGNESYVPVCRRCYKRAQEGTLDVRRYQLKITNATALLRRARAKKGA